MPNVEIVVEASLGDSLVKLDLAEHAVKDLGDSGESASHKLRDFNASMDDATIASHRAGAVINDTEKLIRDAENAITGMTDAIDGGGAGGGGGLISALSASVPLLGGFSVPIAALPVVAAAAAIGVVALADAIGTLVAIVADLVAPLTLVTGLLGLLGAGFFIAAKKAFGMHEDGLGQAISGLKKQFNDLTTTLVGDFMPVFQFLIHNAHDALDYLNRIAKLPLNQAFKSLATTGVQAVSKFLGQVGTMLAKPIRLAVEIAFGTGKGGNEVSSAVSGLWKQFTDFLFGYTKMHPVELRPGVFKMMPRTVDGVLQPFIDWFNRHKFTKQGIEIGHDILNGLMSSGASKQIGQFIINVLEDATKTAAKAAANFIKEHMGYRLWPVVKELAVKAWDYIRDHARQVADAIASWVKTKIGQAWAWVKTQAGNFWSWLRDKAGGIISSIVGWIEGKLTSAWNSVKSAANTFLDILHKIGDFFSQVFTLNINWPSPPSWLSSLVGGLGGGGSSSTAGRTGTGGNSPGAPTKGPNVVAHFHYHAGGSSSESASFRRFAREVSREIGRQNHILAGGQ